MYLAFGLTHPLWKLRFLQAVWRQLLPEPKEKISITRTKSSGFGFLLPNMTVSELEAEADPARIQGETEKETMACISMWERE
jgi:hypothetical protein